MKGYDRWLSMQEKFCALGMPDPDSDWPHTFRHEMQMAYAEALEGGSLPNEMCQHLAWAFHELLSGKTPELFMRASDDLGPPGDTYTVGMLKAWAVGYIKAAEARTIDDMEPKETISRAYGVHTKTVLKWVREMPDVAPMKDPMRLGSKAIVAWGRKYKLTAGRKKPTKTRG